MNQVFFEILGYPVSFLESISAIFGIVAVYYAAIEKIWTWPLGLVNISTAFFLFYQVQLYSDMFLQVYFFGISIYGWYYWGREKKVNGPLKWLSTFHRIQLVTITGIATIGLGYCMTQIHIWLPQYFPKSAAYPYLDTFVAVTSIVANVLLAKRFIENWILWILVDVICVFLYFDKNIRFISLEYFIFLCLASFGTYEWIKHYNTVRKSQLV